jgi:DHA2 family multidrug resistance protein
VIAVGFVLFASSNFMNIYMSSDTAADQLLLPNVVRAIGQALVMTPLSAVAAAGIEAANAGSASALFNMMRNLGGAIGIAGLQTFLTKREQFHSNVLGQSVSIFDEATRTRLDKLTHYFLAHGVSDPSIAWHKAVIAIGHRVQQQAYTMAFADTFYLLGMALVAALLAALLLKKAGPMSAGGAH